MKFKVFWRDSAIVTYWKKHFGDDTLYAVVDVQTFMGLWKSKRVVFYNQEDVVELLDQTVFDVVQKELTIPIKSCAVAFEDWRQHKVKIDLITENDKLLTGKFNQNQQSLETLFSLFLGNFFKTKYEVKLHFQHFKKFKSKSFAPKFGQEKNQ